MEILWILTGVVSGFAALILLCLASESDRGWGAFWIMVGIIALVFINGWGTWEWLKTNAHLLAYTIPAYLALGVLWSIKKFDWYGKDQAKRWRADYGGETEVDIQKREDAKKRYQPLASQNKWRIHNWIVFWPASVLMFALEDMILKFVDWVVETFGHLYDKVAARHFQ